MVSVLVPGASGRGSSPGQDTVSKCVLGQDTLHKCTVFCISETDMEYTLHNLLWSLSKLHKWQFLQPPSSIECVKSLFQCFFSGTSFEKWHLENFPSFFIIFKLGTVHVSVRQFFAGNYFNDYSACILYICIILYVLLWLPQCTICIINIILTNFTLVEQKFIILWLFCDI